MERLVLRGEGLVELPSPLLMRASATLRSLDVSDNQLRSLAPVCVCERVETLRAGSNLIRALPAALVRLRALRVLFLPRNRLRTLPGSLLPHLQCVERLVLTRNRLRVLPPQIASMRALQSLNVTGNRLRSLPVGLAALPALQMLDASDNRIDALPRPLVLLAGLDAPRDSADENDAAARASARHVTVLLAGNPIVGGRGRARADDDDDDDDDDDGAGGGYSDDAGAAEEREFQLALEAEVAALQPPPLASPELGHRHAARLSAPSSPTDGLPRMSTGLTSPPPLAQQQQQQQHARHAGNASRHAMTTSRPGSRVSIAQPPAAVMSTPPAADSDEIEADAEQRRVLEERLDALRRRLVELEPIIARHEQLETRAQVAEDELRELQAQAEEIERAETTAVAAAAQQQQQQQQQLGQRVGPAPPVDLPPVLADDATTHEALRVLSRLIADEQARQRRLRDELDLVRRLADDAERTRTEITGLESEERQLGSPQVLRSRLRDMQRVLSRRMSDVQAAVAANAGSTELSQADLDAPAPSRRKSASPVQLRPGARAVSPMRIGAGR